MGRRYFCEYCNKNFIDELYGRKRHLSSAHHIKMRKSYYEQCRDLRTLFEEESVKTPCHRFLQSRNCQFEGNCKFTHYSKDELWKMQQQILYSDQQMAQKKSATTLPSIESWLDEYKLKNNADKPNQKLVFWDYPDNLNCRNDLPPSLKKFKAEDFPDSDFEEWGQ